MIIVNNDLRPSRLLAEFRLNYGWPLISQKHLEFRQISAGRIKVTSEMFTFNFPDENAVKYWFGKTFFMINNDLGRENHFLVGISIGRDVLNDNGRIISFSLCSPLSGGDTDSKFSFLATVTYVFHKKLGNMKWVDLHHVSSTDADFFNSEFSGLNIVRNSRFADLMDSIHEWVCEFAFIENSCLEPV